MRRSQPGSSLNADLSMKLKRAVSSGDTTAVRRLLKGGVECSATFWVSANCPGKGKRSPYSITDSRVPELIPVLGSQQAGDVSQKPGGRLPLLSARPTVTLANLKRAATNLAAW